MVSIIILTHNAPDYVKLTLESLAITQEVEYEVIVLDNASDQPTQDLLWGLKTQGLIHKLIFVSENTFFSRGNNLAFHFCNAKSDYVLLLNFDVEIRNPQWLKMMLSVHKPGITALGLAFTSNLDYLADGYCCLIDRMLYDRFPMREDFEWWHSLPYTKFLLLQNGYTVQAVRRHDELIFHFGGKSGNDWINAKGSDRANRDTAANWFLQSKGYVKQIYSLTKEVGSSKNTFNHIYGISSDNWCAPMSNFEISTGSKGRIEIVGYNPMEYFGTKEIVFIANNAIVLSEKIPRGLFCLVLSVLPNTLLNIRVNCNFSFKATPPDIRTLSFVLSDINAA